LAHSATLRAKGPMESSVGLKGNAPTVGTRWRLGLKPTTYASTRPFARKQNMGRDGRANTQFAHSIIE
jgi:hypothetical protein